METDLQVNLVAQVQAACEEIDAKSKLANDFKIKHDKAKGVVRKQNWLTMKTKAEEDLQLMRDANPWSVHLRQNLRMQSLVRGVPTFSSFQVNVQTREQLRMIYALRKVVFLQDYKFPKEYLADEYDDTSTHFIEFGGDFPIACARCRVLEPQSELQRYFSIEKFCVIEPFRKKSFGSMLLNHIVTQVQPNLNIRGLVSHVPLHCTHASQAVSFFSRGFKMHGFELLHPQETKDAEGRQVVQIVGVRAPTATPLR